VTTWLHVGTAGCLAACGALALAAQWRGRRAAAPQAGQPAHFHVSGVEPVPYLPGTGALEDVEPYEAFDAYQADAVEIHYCLNELRMTAHAVQADGVRRCWHCVAAEGEA
jgi:hypothetical protein